MRTYDSVCQNRCTIQGRCAVGDCSNTRMLRIEYSSSFNTSIPMKLNQKRETDQRSHSGFLRYQVRHYCKNLEIFMAYIFFSFSTRKLDIVKVLNKTRIWDKLEKSEYSHRAQRILRVADQNKRETIY